MSSRAISAPPPPSGRRTISRSAGLYVLFVLAFTVAYAILSALRSQSWIMGEWLINYQGGFVRRGLLGEVILHVARAFGGSPLAIAVSLQILLYAAFYLSALLLTREVRWSVPLLALFLSPATLSFIVLDPPSSVRKEVLLLLAVALLCLAIARGLRLPPAVLALLLAGAAGVCVLSHEGLIFFLPYLFAPVYLRAAAASPSNAPRVAHWLLEPTLICVPAALAALVSAGASILHPGNAATAAAICSSLGQTMTGEGQGFCGGAIFYLTHDRTYARQDLLRAARAYHYGSLYAIAGALALLPVIAALAALARERRRELRVLLVTAAGAGLGSLVLFSLARDWGRWISIHVTCLLLLLLLFSRRHSPAPSSSTRLARNSRGRRAALALSLLLYSTCWNLPATGNYHARWGYFGLVRYLRTYRSLVHHSSSAL